MASLHQRAIDDPSEWTSLCTDWSNPHYLPHVPWLPKGWATKQR